jgi:hypothetical protein
MRRKAAGRSIFVGLVFILFFIIIIICMISVLDKGRGLRPVHIQHRELGILKTGRFRNGIQPSGRAGVLEELFCSINCLKINSKVHIGAIADRPYEYYCFI